MEDLDKPGATVVNTGDAKKTLGEASKKLEATYYVPCVAHMTMEPMNCYGRRESRTDARYGRLPKI